MTRVSVSTLKKLKNVSHREYMYGDFDKDKVKNIDDPKPFDKKVKKFPKPGHRSQYGGGEVKLSSELLALERSNNKQSSFLIHFLQRHPGSVGRIKTVPSTMKKLRERYYPQIRDVAGAKIVTKNRQQAYAKARKIRKRYSHDPAETDDYYKHPKFSHYGLHYSLLGRKNQRMELQLKSSKMDELDQKAHPYYKRGKGIPARFIKLGKLYFKQGY